jgi:hypothetical protein
VGVFHVESGATVAISGLTIEEGSSPNGGGIFNGGRLTVSKSTLSDNFADTGGGAIWSNGPVKVTDSTLSDNSTDYYGGAIYSASNGTLSVTDSTLSDNSATSFGINYPEYAYGGGIAAYGTATVADTTLAGNRAASFGGGSGGGGIYVGGMMNVTDSTVSGNSNSIAFGANDGDGGAGIDNVGTLNVTDSTLADNTTNANGGGLDNGGTATVSDSTIGANVAATGGGISNDGALTITADTVAGNSADSGGGGGIDDVSGATTAMKATIVADSASGGDCSGSMADGGYNLDDDGSCGLSAVTDHSDVPAGLDPAGLENSGGPTPIIALDPGSAAIGAVTSSSLCSTPDQRGVPRPTPCAIGAVDLVLIPQAITFTSTPPTGAGVGRPGRVLDRPIGVLGVLDPRLHGQFRGPGDLRRRRQPGRRQPLRPGPSGPADIHRRPCAPGYYQCRRRHGIRRYTVCLYRYHVGRTGAGDKDKGASEGVGLHRQRKRDGRDLRGTIEARYLSLHHQGRLQGRQDETDRIPGVHPDRQIGVTGLSGPAPSMTPVVQ